MTTHIVGQTERFVNGDFELGDFTGFVDYPGWGFMCATIDDTNPHSGNYCATWWPDWQCIDLFQQCSPATGDTISVYVASSSASGIQYVYLAAIFGEEESVVLYQQEHTFGDTNYHQITATIPSGLPPDCYIEVYVAAIDGDENLVQVYLDDMHLGADGIPLGYAVKFAQVNIPLEYRVLHSSQLTNNCIINGGFETGDDTGWDVYSGNVTDTNPDTGVYSLESVDDNPV